MLHWYSEIIPNNNDIEEVKQKIDPLRLASFSILLKTNCESV